MFMNRRAKIFTVSVWALAPLPPLSGQEDRRTLENQIPELVANGPHPTGRYPGTARLCVAIGLPLNDKEGLRRFIDALYDPLSANYKRYLTPDQFADRFGASRADYQKVIDFLKSSGLTITGTTPNRMIVDATGLVSDFEWAFHFTMRTYQHPSEARQFHAPDVEPSVPLGIPILDIMGLDDYLPPRRMDAKAMLPRNVQSSLTGSGPDGGFQSADLRAAYVPGVTLDGFGQTVGLFEFVPYDRDDITAFEQASDLPNVPVLNVLLDGVSGSPPPGNDDSEEALDVEMVISMAPGLSQVLVYEGNNAGDILNRMATDNAAKQLSTSWGFLPAPLTMEQIFMEFAAQGQSFLAASGDGGAATSSTTLFAPGGDPYITLVGGTSLTTTGPDGAWLSETAWQYSGGGFDPQYPIPSWQGGVNMSANMGSTTFRNYPDVAIIGEGFFTILNGQSVNGAGTSGSAPLWAGLLALANQQAASSQKPPIGFLNPTIYRLGQGSQYSSDFHDVTVGNNANAASPTQYYAAPGFDLTTGWGTPAGQSLIDDLAGSSSGTPGFSLSVAPYRVDVNQGKSGSVVIRVNPFWGFANSVTLAASGLPTGVVASFSPTSTASTSTLTIAISVSVPAGTYIGTITGASGSSKQTIGVSLTVIAPDFEVSSSPTILDVAPGTSAQSMIGITPVGTFASAVALSVSGTPQGVAASFNPVSTSTSSTLTLSADTQATPGTYALVITATSGGVSHVNKVNLYVPASANAPVPVDLSAAFNVTGIASDGSPFGDGMNGCCAYSANLLGSSLLSAQTVPFIFGTTTPWNTVHGTDLTKIQLPPGRFSSLQILGTGLGAQMNQAFQVNYSDGTSSKFMQSLSDWHAPQNFPGEANVVSMPYFNGGTGVKETPSVYLYNYGFTLDDCRTVASFTPPANGSVEILALTLVPAVFLGPTICGVQNAAASRNPPVLAPGTFATIYGVQVATQSTQAMGAPFPVTLGGVSVTVNGTPAPLYYVSPAQINFVVPWEVTGTQATIIVQVHGNTSNGMSVAIAPSVPSIFTVNQQGTGQAAALITGTASLAAPVGAFPGSRPVKRGEYISLFATGLGAVQNQPTDGFAPSGLSPTVQSLVGNISTSYPKAYFYLNQEITPQFAGLAPGFVGLYQINIQIPQSAASGDAVEMYLSSSNDNIVSNVVTIAIQ